MKQTVTNEHYYIVELLLNTEMWQEHIIDTRLECGRRIYNALLDKVAKRYKEMTKTKRYRDYISNLYMQDVLEDNTQQEDEAITSKVNKKVKKQLNALIREFKLTENDLKNEVKHMQHHFKCHLHSRVCQEIATQVYNSLKSVLYGKGKKFHFKKFGTFNTLKSNERNQAILFKDTYIEWTGLSIPIKFPKYYKSMEFINTHLYPNLSRLCYCCIVRKEIRGRYKYYVQLVFRGESVASRYPLGVGRVGIDIGTSTIAISSDSVVDLIELAEGVQELEKERNKILRAMDRSRRANNPNKYNEDGTTKKGNTDKWVNSNRYNKLASKLREVYRKQRVERRLQHNKLSNYILSLGNDFYVEKMSFAGLAKRSTKPTKYKENGKCKRKKRFGKSIGNRAPSLLLTILNNKLIYSNQTLNYINTQKCKASQFNHITQTYTKKSLSQRWNMIEGIPVQRDLYSAFLISNTTSTLDSFDIDLCNYKYDNFLSLHNIKIEELKQEKLDTCRKFLDCMGI